MKTSNRQSGSVMMMTVFVIALLSTLVITILDLNSTDIQIMQTQVHAVEALMTAEAGLENALAQLRLDATWNDGFTNKAFNGGAYSVEVDNEEITSVSTSDQGFTANVVATVTISTAGPPYTVRVDTFDINVKNVGVSPP